MCTDHIVPITYALTFVITSLVPPFSKGCYLEDIREFFSDIGENIANAIKTKWILRLLIGFCWLLGTVIVLIMLICLAVITVNPYYGLAVYLPNLMVLSILSGFCERADKRIWELKVMDIVKPDRTKETTETTETTKMR